MSNDRHIDFRASAMPRIEKCPGSALKEGYDSWNGAASLGTALHLVAERMIRGEDWEVASVALAYGVNRDELEYLAWRAKALWDREHLPHTDTTLAELMPEPVVEKKLHYEGRGYRISGTRDIGYVDRESAEGYVVDWKSGWSVMSNYNAQLATYAMLELVNAPIPLERVWVAIVWLRTGEVESRWIARDELTGWMGRLGDIADEARAGVLADGPQCTYCPAIPNCRCFDHASKAMREGDVPPIDDENCYAIHVMRQAVERNARRANQIVKAFLATRPGGVPAEDGKRLTLVVSGRDEVLPEKALEWLMDEFPGRCDHCMGSGKIETQGGETDQDGKSDTGVACPECGGTGRAQGPNWLSALSLSKSAIMDLAADRAKRRGEPVGKARAGVVNALKALGALQRKESERAEVVQPK